MNYLKLSLLLIFFVFSSFYSFSQTFNEPVGQKKKDGTIKVNLLII